MNQSEKLSSGDAEAIQENINKTLNKWIICASCPVSGKQLAFHLNTKRFKVSSNVGDPIKYTSLGNAIKAYNRI